MHSETGTRLKEELPAIAFCCAMVALALVIVRYALLPVVLHAGDQRRDISVYRAALSEQAASTSLRSTIAADNARLKDKLTKLAAGMGDANDLSGLLGVLIDRASSAGIRFVKVQPQGEKRENDYTLYPVVLEMTTSCKSLGTFVASLESIPQIVRVGRLSVTALRGERLDVKILITCFLHAQEAGNDR